MQDTPIVAGLGFFTAVTLLVASPAMAQGDPGAPQCVWKKRGVTVTTTCPDPILCGQSGGGGYAECEPPNIPATLCWTGFGCAGCDNFIDNVIPVPPNPGPADRKKCTVSCFWLSGWIECVMCECEPDEYGCCFGACGPTSMITWFEACYAETLYPYPCNPACPDE